MGKQHQLPLQQGQQQQQQIQEPHDSSIICARCASNLSIIRREINIKCVVVLIFSLSVFISAVFWIVPHRSRSTSTRYDAKEEIKLRATVQACFRLQKPVSVLVPHIDRLEYDIYAEVGVPSTKVAILSLHQADTKNWTDVEFGILPDPIDATINPVYLSLVRSSLIDLFLQQSNLSLTTTIFGQPSSFEISRFPGGITVIPEPTAFVSHISLNFNFVLNSSICEIKEHLVLLKEQMKSWLLLMPYENVFVQVTNQKGSTTERLVVVLAQIVSDMGTIVPERSKQLAKRITNSPPSTNLGLNDRVFGKVKQISLSSSPNSPHAFPPMTSPAPSPSDISPSYPSALSPSNQNSHSPSPETQSSYDCGSKIPPSPSLASDIGPAAPPSAYPVFVGPRLEVFYDLFPSPALGDKDLLSPPLALP